MKKFSKLAIVLLLALPFIAISCKRIVIRMTAAILMERPVHLLANGKAIPVKPQ